MHPTADHHTPRARSPHRALLLVATLTVGLFTGSLVGGPALASHQFSDVPESSQFHIQIGWMAQHGIASGYPDGTYRPGQAVSRQAMAAFMSRFNDAFVVRQSSLHPGSGSTHTHTTECEAGERAIAGGGFNSSGNTFITENRPFASGGSGWTVVWETEGNVLQDPFTLTVWALCAPYGTAG